MRTRIQAAAPVPVALLAALGLAVAGCGASEVRTPPESSPDGATSSPTGTGDRPETELTIDITTADSASPSGPAGSSSSAPSPSPTEPQHWRLTCHPAGGDHPEPEAACADLSEAGGAEAFEEVPESTPCTFIYGGPQIARVEGHVGDTRVDTKFTKSGGCEMKRYEDLGAVLTP